ncbi:hypothetical protein [Acidithiobacillus ferrooxidans]|uniref:hypothetical protein n=1 Tax=Acidithiobacillus ferrooxidans TaxID=920 RepID=UPI000B0F3673|nr:hypothetical protein [Acidithiobacillus ferrooxidans]
MPKIDEKKICNRRMSIADDMGDNEASIRCQLPRGHKGPHQEQHTSGSHGVVTITFEKGHVPPVDFARISHIIPKGETCIPKDGATCPFYAFLGMDGEDQKDTCYLHGEHNIVYNDELRKDWNCLDATN